MPSNYDKELIQVKNSVNELLFRSVGQPPEVFAKINKLYEDIENSTDKTQTKKLIRSLKDTILENPVIKAIESGDDAQKEQYKKIQENLAAFIKKKWNESFNLGIYAKTLESASPKDLERVINSEGKDAYDQTAQIILRAEDMVDANGKPKSLIDHYHMDVKPIKDDKGNITGYSVESEYPVPLVQNCIALGKTGIVIDGFHNSLLKRGESRKFVEDMFREANKNLYPINVEVNYGRGHDAKNHPITGAAMMDRQSKEGQKLININKALKTVHDKNPNADSYEKTISTYALLLDEDKKEEANMFLQQQRSLHSNDPSYLHNLNIEALKQSTDKKNPPKKYNYETFCKAMSLKEDVTNAQTEAKEQTYDYHKKMVDYGGELKQMTDHLLISIDFLPDKKTKDDFTDALKVEIDKRIALLDELEEGLDNYDIKKTEDDIQDLKQSLKGLEKSLNRILSPEEEVDLIAEEEIGPDNMPYPIDELEVLIKELIDKKILPENFERRIIDLEEELKTEERPEMQEKMREELEKLEGYLHLTPSKALEKLEKLENAIEEKPENELLLTEKNCLKEFLKLEPKSPYSLGGSRD